MATERKRPGIITTEHLLTAENALAAAAALQLQALTKKASADAKRREVDEILAEIKRRDTIVRYPDMVTSAIAKVRLFQAEADRDDAQATALNAQAWGYFEMARRSMTHAMKAHKVDL